MPAYNQLAPTTANLATGYVVFDQAEDRHNQRGETRSDHERTYRYLVRAVAGTRSQALALRTQADALLLDTPLVIDGGDVTQVRRGNAVSYREPLGAGTFAHHLGYLYSIHITTE